MGTLNLGTAGVALSGQGSTFNNSATKYDDAIPGTIIQMVASSTTSEQTTTSASYQDFMSCSITPRNSYSFYQIFVFPIRTEIRTSMEGNIRVSDGTNVTERYRFQTDSTNGYYTLAPISWYWPLARTAGVSATFTVQCRDGSGSSSDSITMGDNGSTSRMIIYEIAQ
jgi:hypothetical protein